MNNVLILVGRFTKDLELRSTSNGKYVLDMPLAISNGKDDTTFINVSVFGATAELVNKYCKKGDMIGVNAMVRNHNWTDKEGNKHYDYSFIANRINFLGSKKQDATQIEEDIPKNIKTEYDDVNTEIHIDDSDLPF